VTELADRQVEHVVTAALCRAVLLARAAVAMTAAAVGLLVVDEPVRVVGLLALLSVTSAAQIGVLTRWPAVVGHPVVVLAVDSVLVLAVLTLSHGGLAYFCYAASSAALAGVLLGIAALPLWAAQLVQGFAVCVTVLRDTHPPAAVATFLLAAPVAGLLAGAGAVLTSRALVRQMRLSVRRVTTAQRSAAALERARLARELHDSVAKTLRAMSLAALALPGSVRRQPGLAEQLAGVVSSAAVAANRETRELLEGLRLDSPDEDFSRTIARLCRAWSARTGITAWAEVAVPDLPVPVRYELARIAHEALTNVSRHAHATRVTVALAQRGGLVALAVCDDGMGFVVPDDLAVLQDHGHLGVVGMVERARTLGGRLEVASRPGGGTTVQALVPLR
jgi:signal transduction histidine kinase